MIILISLLILVLAKFFFSFLFVKILKQPTKLACCEATVLIFSIYILMSVDISISNKTQTNCSEIISKLLKSGIEARVIETTSIFNNQIEKGCLITVGKEYSDQKRLSHLWDIISPDYSCSHINIKDKFNGCIYDYLAYNNKLIYKILETDGRSLCPHNK